ncbi:hypothetical protein BDR06DRAFT_1002397 [Suillus hirtellus]|nr:hypothetical protein BDR06DRAFT_1002397 [Suillus hirtellus]
MEDCAAKACITGNQTNAWVSQAITYASNVLKVNHVPWCIPPTGRNGVPSSVVVHDVWLNLGAAERPLTKPSASFLTWQESLHMAALQSSEAMELSDTRGDWNALSVHLNKFSSILHKTILPVEWDKNTASLATCSQYVADTYNYIQNAFNPTIPLHQLAVIVAIAFAGLTPNIFAPTIVKGQVPKQLNELSAYIRGQEWVSLCATSQEPFITMMSTFIIAMSDPGSPISQRVQSGTEIKEWLTKHCKQLKNVLATLIFGLTKYIAAKGIMILSLC